MTRELQSKIAKLRNVQQTVERVAAKIGSTVTTSSTGKSGGAPMSSAGLMPAVEVGRHRLKYFTWLCKRNPRHHGPQAGCPMVLHGAVAL